ncbi:MAG: DNA-directed RNA polymerase subunit alpha [Candidatus Paceibacterota bacterium]|jgi:DNA-directed RNA polymerase subunit alpha
MSNHNIILPSKPRVVSEEEMKGVYEIDGLYPGYGHTLGNSLRRIILSSLPGAAITSVKIDGVSHEFSVVDGIKEDVITMLLHLKQVRFKMSSDEPQVVTLSVKGPKLVTAGDIKTGGQVEVLNPELYIVEVTDKNTHFNIEMTIEKGLGFVPKDVHQKGKVDIGTIALDAIFTPIRRVSYEVENMRVGDKTNHNRLRMIIETDGTISPREALETSIKTMIEQLGSILDFKVDIASEMVSSPEVEEETGEMMAEMDEKKSDEIADILKTRIDTLDLSTRTLNALSAANIRTVGGVARKKSEDLLELAGMGEKGIQEIKRALSNFGITLK